jgi:hypothetical protein
MITAEPFFVPSVWITTVAATTHVSFKPNPVAFVVTFIEALLTDYATFVFFTVFAFPGYITSF